MIKCSDLRYNNYLNTNFFDVKNDLFEKLYKNYKKDFLLNIHEFTSNFKSKIQKAGFKSRNDFENYLNNEIDNAFYKNVTLTDDFRVLLIQDLNYAQYFSWFKKYYYIKFFEGFPIENINTTCIIEEDIENPDETYIKIVIVLPIEDSDYEDLLKLMKFFIKAQELLITFFIKKYNFPKEIFKNFKRTFFIFKSIEE